MCNLASNENVQVATGCGLNFRWVFVTVCVVDQCISSLHADFGGEQRVGFASPVICWRWNCCLGQGSAGLFAKCGSEVLASQEWYRVVRCGLHSEPSQRFCWGRYFFLIPFHMHAEKIRILHNCKGIRSYLCAQSDPGGLSPPAVFSVLGCVQMLYQFYLETNRKNDFVVCGQTLIMTK